MITLCLLCIIVALWNPCQAFHVIISKDYFDKKIVLTEIELFNQVQHRKNVGNGIC
jgi:hypothetical protein